MVNTRGKASRELEGTQVFPEIKKISAFKQKCFHFHASKNTYHKYDLGKEKKKSSRLPKFSAGPLRLNFGSAPVNTASSSGKKEHPNVRYLMKINKLLELCIHKK